MSLLRAILILCRVPTLFTIWSNCLAGWWLGGHRHESTLPFLLAGSSLLYLGGCFLNDAFDADFDREFRRTRPIPSGALSLKSVWRWGVALLVLGVLLLLLVGTIAAGLALGIVFCIICFNTFHRALNCSALFLGIARCLLYSIASLSAAQEVSGFSIWCGLALLAYVTGTGFFRRWVHKPAFVNYWPVLLLAVPLLLAAMMDAGEYRNNGLLLSAVLGLWVLRALRPTFWSPERNVSATVADLLSGIIFVDWLACADGPRELSFIFLGLFGAAALLQRGLPKAGIPN